MLRELIAVGLGGMLGSMARYAMSSLWLAGCSAGAFPTGTFSVNAVGSLAIGFLMASMPQGSWYWFAVTGVCGGFTTFSTFSADAVRLFRQGQASAAMTYVVASVAVCLLCTLAGIWLATRLKSRIG